MWCCITCRKKFEEHIVLDLKIEDRCNQIMKEYEDRITQLETTVKEKCDEKRVREIIKDELGKVENNEDTVEGDTQDIRAKTVKKEAVTIVIDEMNERKSRENNLIIFGFDENQSEVRQERIDHDIQQVNELYKACIIQLDTTSIKKTGRLGKFNNEKRDRPLLVTLSSVESKLVLFKNFHRIRELTEYEKVNVSNDLTKAEREKEKELWQEAKKQQLNDKSGDFIYKVRGPPWARRVTKLKKPDI
jgi:hypothetical protein